MIAWQVYGNSQKSQVRITNKSLYLGLSTIKQYPFMKERKNKIVVPVDFHEQSMIALEQTRNIARFMNAEIVILYIIESVDLISSMFRKGDQDRKILEEVKRKLDELAGTTSEKFGLPVSVRIEKGKVYREILRVAEEISARFIIMGKNDADEGYRRFIGSNTNHVISNANCPVITIKGKEHNLGVKNIVLPLDLTKKTREKVFNAVSFGLHFDSAIWMVSVLTGGISLMRSRIYAKMKRAKKMIEENGVPCNIKLFKKTETPDYEIIIKYALDIDADLIMIMTHQESNWRDHYIGTFAHEIINRSDIPVMTMIPGDPRKNRKLVKTFIDPFGIFGKKNKT
jgi:nucleotide-binding universal stress UspA family protein